MNQKDLRVGTAGWGIPSAHTSLFPEGVSHLSRYAKVLNCTEINTSFYRPHRPATYERWTASTPEHFQFSVKLPKWISHESGLRPDREQMKAFFNEVAHLGEKLGPILVQLPPKQNFVLHGAESFLSSLRELHPDGSIVLEPRHKDWFSPEVDPLLQKLKISRVIADPAPVPQAAEPGGDISLLYYRLHGSPRIYSSSYSTETLARIAGRIKANSRTSAVWCIFDNTASGAAAQNALATRDLLSQ